MSSWYPPPSKPRPVADGIKARSKRGDIAQTWWSKRFIGHLEALGLEGRLARGRTYARKGQVLGLHVGAGAVEASVQGSRKRPYRVRIGLRAFGKEDWNRIVEALTEDAWFAAKLLSGEMPPDIEDLLDAIAADRAEPGATYVPLPLDPALFYAYARPEPRPGLPPKPCLTTHNRVHHRHSSGKPRFGW